MTTMLLEPPAPIVDDATRRQFLIGGLSLTVLAGCGSDRPIAAPSVPPDGPFPVKLENKFGLVTIPEQPQRVVAIGVAERYITLALGVKPVAVGGYGDVHSFPA